MRIKAQAALEFLMTYGWAILIVLGAISALAYFGVLNPDRVLPEQCTFPAGFTCIDTAVVDSSNNRFDFAIRNNQGFRVNITGINDDPGADDDCVAPALQGCTGLGCSPAAVPDGIVFDNDQQGILRVTCTEINEGRFKADIVLRYYSFESGITHTVTGQVRGQAS
ncbi:hypothetical protein HY640_03485 [Candidatus Woesearchaeota archaeon]|nr:hypothetical protein [Candidatus Woesearchaeota archaeon]